MISTRISPWSPKLLAILAPSIVGGLAFWFFVSQALRGHVAFNNAALINIGLFLLLGFFFLGLWLGPAMLVSYVGRWRSLRWVVAVISAIVMMPFFPLHVWTAAAVVALALCFAWGLETMYEDAQNRLTASPMRSVPRGITFIIFGVLASISLLYYQQLRGDAKTADALSQRFINQTVSFAERSLPLIYKSYRPEMTVDELIGAEIPTADGILKDISFSSLKTTVDKQNALNDRLSQLGLDPNSVRVSAQESEAALRQQIDRQITLFRQQTIDQTREELSQRFNIAITPNETIHDVLVGVIGYQFDHYVRRYVTFVPMLLALALFFVLRFATSVLQATVVWSAWFFFKLFRWLHVLAVTPQTVPAEKVEWGS